MSRNSIGGFFVDLGMNIDKGSFEKSYKAIEGIGNNLNKITGIARNTAVVLATTAIAGGTMASAETKVAAAMGLSVEQLNKWKAAAKIAGVNANGLVASMSQLSKVMAHTGIDGSGLEQYAEKLSFLGLNISDLLGMDVSDAYQTIIETAQSKINGGEDKTRIYNIVSDVLGNEGRDLVIELTRRQMGIAGALNDAGKTQFEDSNSVNKGADFMNEVRTLTTTIESISKLLGEQIGGALTPTIKTLNSWLENNGDIIKNGIKELTSTITTLVEKGIKIGGFVGKSYTVIKEAAIDVVDTIKSGKSVTKASMFQNHGLDDDIINGLDTITKVENELMKFARENNIKTDLWGRYRIQMETLPIETQNKINSIPGGKDNFKSFIQDGIIRPNGQVTQVAPDDWVFAARNVGDLARAFIPQGMANNNGNAQFNITQNFTINGARDTAQTIKQQAFNGTRSALFESMAKSGHRLQQMSGTR